MLHKKNRLAKDKDIQTAFARGRTFFNPFYNIKFLASASGSPRFAVVVSTKVFKAAVARNRLKRIIRENLRKNMGDFKKGDYMIMAKPKVSRLPEADRLSYFLQLLNKIR